LGHIAIKDKAMTSNRHPRKACRNSDCGERCVFSPEREETNRTLGK